MNKQSINQIKTVLTQSKDKSNQFEFDVINELVSKIETGQDEKENKQLERYLIVNANFVKPKHVNILIKGVESNNKVYSNIFNSMLKSQAENLSRIQIKSAYKSFHNYLDSRSVKQISFLKTLQLFKMLK
jgi:phosphopantetheine adenylyltransferase